MNCIALSDDITNNALQLYRMNAVKSIYYTAMAGYARVARRRELGSSIFDADWDICIILDSARADMVDELLDVYFKRGQVEISRRWSQGSATTEWLASTFRKSRAQAIADTTLVTAHPHTGTVFDDRSWLTTPSKAPVGYPNVPAVEASAFTDIHRLYKTHAEEWGVVTAETMADATIAAHRQTDGAVVAHWMQPHEPFIAPDAPVVGGKALEGNVWAGLTRGEFDSERVWQAYSANLGYALELVQLVSRAVDARILLTADHGNLWNVAGQYGHPFGCWHPEVRRVPWVYIEAERQHDWTPDIDLTTETMADTTPTDQLAALGYA